MLRLAFLSLTVTLCAVACRAPEASPNAKRYDVKGKVVAVNKAERRVTIAHEEIGDYMTAMTMPFAVKKKDDWALNVLAPGDEITATLVVDDSLSWIENIVIAKEGSRDAGEAKTDEPAEARAGDVLPNFSLSNQDGKRINLAQYRGRVLLLTFVYTRCPLPDYCPLMSNNFAAIEKELKKNQHLYERTHLLTVSFDPEYDTPKVMRSYGGAYTENYTSENFAHWEFATGTPEEVRSIAQFFGLRYYKEADQIVHGLRTAVVGADGKIVKVYRGNEWKPEEIMRDVQALLGSA